jgi:hypothetical protein
MSDVKQSDIGELMRFRLSYDEARDRLLLEKAAERFPHSYRSAEVRAHAAARQSDRRDAEMEYLIRWAKRKLRRPKQGATSLSRSSGRTSARRVKGPSARRK